MFEESMDVLLERRYVLGKNGSVQRGRSQVQKNDSGAYLCSRKVWPRSLLEQPQHSVCAGREMECVHVPVWRHENVSSLGLK
jgi:hypothetical protein